jgi:hypothetical protein
MVGHCIHILLRKFMASFSDLNDERYEPLTTLIQTPMNVDDIDRSLTLMQ